MIEEPDVSLFIEALQKYGGVRPRWDGHYTPLDMYRDFRAVFSTEQGQRVLAHISRLCNPGPRVKGVSQEGPFMPGPEASHQEMIAYAARREVGMTIFAWATIPPREPPAQPVKPKR